MSDNDAVQVITQEQQWYRFIADKAGMTLWEYFVPEKKIVIHYPAVIKFGIPRTFENVPESIIPVIDEHSVADLLSMYRDITEGKKETAVWEQKQAGKKMGQVIYAVPCRQGLRPGRIPSAASSAARYSRNRQYAPE